MRFILRRLFHVLIQSFQLLGEHFSNIHATIAARGLKRNSLPGRVERTRSIDAFLYLRCIVYIMYSTQPKRRQLKVKGLAGENELGIVERGEEGI